MLREIRHDISTGGVVLSIYRLGNPYYKSDEDIAQWLAHQHDVATKMLNESFEATVARMADPRITTIDWTDTYQASSTLSIDGTTVLIKLTINGISHVSYTGRSKIARIIMSALEGHAIKHLQPVSPEEEFARYLDPAVDTSAALGS